MISVRIVATASAVKNSHYGAPVNATNSAILLRLGIFIRLKIIKKSKLDPTVYKPADITANLWIGENMLKVLSQIAVLNSQWANFSFQTENEQFSWILEWLDF